MPVTFIQSGRFGAAAGYDADAAALFARWGTDPGSTRKQLYSDCIAGLKADTDWALIDVLQVYAAHTQADGLLDWKNNSDATLVNSPTFTTDRGVTMDGSTNYINTNYVPSTDGVNYAQDSACVGVYINQVVSNASSSTIAACGSLPASGGSLRLFPKDAGGRVRGRINSTGSDNFTGATPNTRAGFTTINRSGSTATEGFRNGSSVGTAGTTSGAVPTIEVFVGAENNNGSAAGFMDARFAVFMAAGALDATRQARVYARLLTLLTAIGAN